jgi:hypothetical protein
MIEYGAAFLGQVIGVLLWSFLNAAILLWRARKLKNWAIRYKDAYAVSLKAGLIGLVSADAAILAVAFLGNTSEDLLKYVGLLFGVVAWWFAHSSALLKLPGALALLTVKDARAISASVFGFLFGAYFALALIVMLIVAVVGAIK